MGKLPDIGYPQTGDLAEPGIYACMQCEHTEPEDDGVVILNKKEKLPKCPACGNTYWMPI